MRGSRVFEPTQPLVHDIHVYIWIRAYVFAGGLCLENGPRVKIPSSNSHSFINVCKPITDSSQFRGDLDMSSRFLCNLTKCSAGDRDSPSNIGAGYGTKRWSMRPHTI